MYTRYLSVADLDLGPTRQSTSRWIRQSAILAITSVGASTLHRVTTASASKAATGESDARSSTPSRVPPEPAVRWASVGEGTDQCGGGAA